MIANSPKLLQTLSTSPGVYILYNRQHQVLYIGKARNLKKRVASYFREKMNKRLDHLMEQVHSLETILTQTENQALLLESNLIKQLRPRYNILLRDDKSYPYIVLSNHPNYPRLDACRGQRRNKNTYFGPYPNSTAVKQVLNLLHKLFRLRSCTDSFFRNRTHPCLQYQIKRCTAPCVNFVSPQDYQRDVQRTKLFLQGKSQELTIEVRKQMEAASQCLDYEHATQYRDQIACLQQIQEQQVISTRQGNLDIIGLSTEQSHHSIYVMNIRAGQLLGGRPYFPKAPTHMKDTEVLAEFLSQFYLQETPEQSIPQKIILSHNIPTETWLAQALSEQIKRKIKITHSRRAELGHWIDLAQQNAYQALFANLAEKNATLERLQELQTLLKLPSTPQRIECFDVSHTQGDSTMAACVVFNTQGPYKQDYRLFTITQVKPGDDYAAMKQALMRRYTSLKKLPFPDVVILDGGQGQLVQACQVLAELQLNQISLLAIAKGPDRKPGQETLFLPNQSDPVILPSHSPTLHFLQRIRDEAHRLAIKSHRRKRAKKSLISPLNNLPGIGPERKKALLKHFGGLQLLRQATIHAIATVPGIGAELAQRIYLAFKQG